jgi:REP element-mobilizing transposase RayT
VPLQEGGDRVNHRTQTTSIDSLTYFVTICSYRREHLFGEVIEQEVVLSAKGRIVREERLRTEIIRKEITLDEFVIVPNHIHGIIHLTHIVGARRRRAPTSMEQFGKPVAGSLSTILRAYKSKVTRRINIERSIRGESVWQRGYVERIIRNEKELAAIRRYISESPVRWA